MLNFFRRDLTSLCNDLDLCKVEPVRPRHVSLRSDLPRIQPIIGYAILRLANNYILLRSLNRADIGHIRNIIV